MNLNTVLPIRDVLRLDEVQIRPDHLAPDFDKQKQRTTLLPRLGETRPSEIEYYERLAAPHVGKPIILLSVGANDLGFGPILEFCLLHLHCYSKHFASSFPLPRLVQLRLNDLRHSYARLETTPAFETGTVFLTQYFDPLHDQNGELCTIKLAKIPAITQAEAAWAENSIVKPLNQLLEQQAAQAGWHYITGIANDFFHHGYCATNNQSWIRQIPTAVLKRNLKGAFHPNQQGQGDYTNRLFTALEPYLRSAK